MVVCDIKIDKRSGRWNLHNASDLDNIAYYFYLIIIREYRKKYFSSIYFSSTRSQIEHYKQCKGSGKSYKVAELYLRNYKIKKIKEKICLNHVM